MRWDAAGRVLGGTQRARAGCLRGKWLEGGERKRPGKEVRDAQPGGGGGERGERKG